jgi:hypothetical protein
MTTARKLVYLILCLCIVTQVAVLFSSEFHRWFPAMDEWKVAATSTLIALAASIYAGTKVSRRWFLLTVLEVLMAFMVVVALA